ncbi:hypothetical protein [Absidia glauca]|uniref:Uncharacterized protein n=1 Tax=Absidia glauca TaxID=4829 RepID=A0A163IV16_ABSGL|nr:hypothetical protein [Absidia glauca]
MSYYSDHSSFSRSSKTTFDRQEEGPYFDPEAIMQSYIHQFGEAGCDSLSATFKFFGKSKKRVGNITIEFDGQVISGPRTIASLMDEGSLSETCFRVSGFNRDLFYMSTLAAAMPHSPLLFVKNLHDVDDDQLKERLLTPKVASIPTSLPVALRYYNAASLPLRPKTRLAHITWCMKFQMAYFKLDHYKRKSEMARYYAKMPAVVELLASIEESIVLNEDEA